MHRTLLCIHGFPHDGSFWRGQEEALAGAATVMAPDLRGFGHDRAPLPTAMSMEAYATDLHDLLDAAGRERVVLCGLSMGGYVALSFIDQWPERVEGLILCNTRATADGPEGRTAREQTARDAEDKGAAVIARAMAPKLLSERTRMLHPEICSRMERMMAEQRPEAIAAAARGMAERPDRSELLPRIEVPTLIITGSDDALMPLETSEALHRAIPGSRMMVIQGAGHLSPVEAPALFNEAVELFLDELEDLHRPMR